MKQNIDDLHAVVSEARLRKQTEEVRQDVWREDLHPRAATRSRTIPVLEDARNKLLAELQQVRI
jgi:Nnf1